MTLLKPRRFKIKGLCSQTTLLPGCVSLKRHPWSVMELHLQRHQLTISPSKWIGVAFTVLVTLFYLDTEKAVWHSALIHAREIKLHLHSCEHACVWVLNPHVDLGVLFCNAKSTQQAEGWHGSHAQQDPAVWSHSLTKTENLCKPQITKAVWKPMMAASM